MSRAAGLHREPRARTSRTTTPGRSSCASARSTRSARSRTRTSSARPPIAPFVDGTIPTTLDKQLAPEGVHVFSMFSQWVPDDWNTEPHRDELEAYADRIIDGYTELAPNFKAAVIDRQVIGPYDMEQDLGLIGRQHLPRRAQRGSAVPHAPGARLRRLPHADQGPVPRLVRHARRRRRQRHPRLAGVQHGEEGQGRRPRRSGDEYGRRQPAANPTTDRARAHARGALGRRRRRQRQGRLARPPDDGRAAPRRLRGRDLPGEPRLRRGPRVSAAIPSIADLPEPVDLAILGVANQRIEQALQRCGRRRRPHRPSRSRRCTRPSLPSPACRRSPSGVAAIARDAGIAMCGGNGMGFLNLEANLRATGFATPDHIRRGTGDVHQPFRVGVRRARVQRPRDRLQPDRVVAGRSSSPTIADYMEYALGLASTRVIALLLETVRRPEAFRAALAHAAERDIPVIALKVGRTERSKSMVTAHSGALAGEDGAYEALFDAYGVSRVAHAGRDGRRDGALLEPARVTTGARHRVDPRLGRRARAVRRPGRATSACRSRGSRTRPRERIQAALDPGLEAANPLDAWGTGIDADRIFVECFQALHDDPDTAALAFVVDMTRQGEPLRRGLPAASRARCSRQTTKPFCILSNLASAVANDEAALAARRRDPGARGDRVRAGGAAAPARLPGRARAAAGRVAPEPVADDVRERWRARLAAGGAVSELEGLALLADYGVPVTAGAWRHVDRRARSPPPRSWAGRSP